MKKGFSKVAAAVLVGSMAVSMLAGCGSSSKETEAAADTEAAEEAADGEEAADSADLVSVAAEYGKEYTGDAVELSWWYLTTRQEGAEALVEAWNEANPNVQVTVSFYDTDGIKDSCKTAAQSGSLPSMWFNWGGALGQYYVDNGCTYDLTQYAADNNWADEISSGALTLCTLSDQICGFPTSFNVIGMYYRTDIFEQCGIEIPTTSEEFDAACATLKENGYTPITTAGLNGWHVMRLIEQFIETEAGADLHDQLQALTTSWDCDAVINAFQRYQDYCNNGYFPDGFVTASPDDTYMAFAQGTAAMDIQGQWYDSTLQNNGMTLENVSWFPFPNGTGRMSAFAEMNQFNVNLTDDELAAAMAFNHFFYGNEAVAEYTTYYNTPLPYASADGVDNELLPNVQNMLDTASANGTFTITDQAFPQEVADILFSNQDAMANGETTPADAAAAVQAAIEAYQAK